MIDEILGVFQEDWVLMDSVSGGDSPALPPSMVSGGDNMTGGDYYQINLYTLPAPDGQEETAVQEEVVQEETQYTLWDKPLEEYTVSEGLLLILVVIAVAVLAWKIIGGGFKWLK